MKKIIITLVFVLGSVSIYSTATRFENSEKRIIKSLQDEFKEIDIAILPTAITEAVAKDFKSAAISKAYINDVKEYKLILKEEGVLKTVYVTETGIWINK
ncbi:hypothetical protein [uncultured Formosa sp.]|uniref:hypothetical protein n=1 Tax=uncultured Formosa sp. TaxID=255435 RepID=UPI0026225147|nr:hypothetical protein [uncultured Formosa sp.]